MDIQGTKPKALKDIKSGGSGGSIASAPNSARTTGSSSASTASTSAAKKTGDKEKEKPEKERTKSILSPRDDKEKDKDKERSKDRESSKDRVLPLAIQKDKEKEKKKPKKGDSPEKAGGALVAHPYLFLTQSIQVLTILSCQESSDDVSDDKQKTPRAIRIKSPRKESKHADHSRESDESLPDA